MSDENNPVRMITAKDVQIRRKAPVPELKSQHDIANDYATAVINTLADRLSDECAMLRARNAELELRLKSWPHSCDAMEWLDDDSPLVVQTRTLLDRKAEP